MTRTSFDSRYNNDPVTNQFSRICCSCSYILRRSEAKDLNISLPPFSDEFGWQPSRRWFPWGGPWPRLGLGWVRRWQMFHRHCWFRWNRQLFRKLLFRKLVATIALVARPSLPAHSVLWNLEASFNILFAIRFQIVVNKIFSYFKIFNGPNKI